MFKVQSFSKIFISAAFATSVCMTALQPATATTQIRDGSPPQSVNGMPLSDYLGSHEYWDQLQTFTVKFERSLGPCAEAQMNRRYKTVPAKQAFQVPGIGAPPQWVELLKIEGCAKPFQRNVAVFLIEGQPKFMPILHGTSKADPFLQVDVMRMLLPTARAQASRTNCANANEVRILGTKFTGERLTELGMAWKETWRIADCHGSHDYQIRYMPSSRGGTSFHITSL